MCEYMCMPTVFLYCHRLRHLLQPWMGWKKLRQLLVPSRSSLRGSAAPDVEEEEKGMGCTWYVGPT